MKIREAVVLGIALVLLIPLVIATTPVMSSVTIFPSTAYQNDTLIINATATDADGNGLVYFCDILLEGSLNESIVSEGTQWHENNFEPNSDIGSRSAPTVFNISNTIYLIAGENDLTFNGFQWNVTGGWFSNSSIVEGISIIGSSFKPTINRVQNTTYLIVGENAGSFNGFQLNGTKWFENSSIITGLGDVGSRSAPALFNISTDVYVISGESGGDFTGFQWNTTGKTWFSNASIVAGLSSVDGNSTPTIFIKSGNLYFITGITTGKFEGYVWTGTTWTDSTYIETGLGDVGSNSAPVGYTKNSSLHLIVGEEDGVFTSFLFSDDENTKVNVANITSTHLTRGQNWSVNCTAYDGGTFSLWVNSSVLQISNTLPVVNTTSIVPSPASLSDNLNIIYTCYDYDTGDTCNSSVEYNWYINGTSLGINNMTLGSGNTSNGNNVTGSIRVSDGLNWSEWKNTSTINIGDNESPAITAYSLSSTSTNVGTPITIYATCEDAGSSLDYVRAEVNKSLTCSEISNSSMSLISGDDWSVSYYPPCTGTYYVTKIYCKDQSGNENNTNTTLTFTATTAPSIGGGSGGTTTIISEKGMFTVTTIGGQPENTDYLVKGIESCLKLIVTSISDAEQNIEVSCASKDKSCTYAEIKEGNFTLRPTQKQEVEICTTIPKDVRIDGYTEFRQVITIKNEAEDKVVFPNTLILGGVQGQLAMAINWFTNTFARSIGWSILSILSWFIITSVFFWIAEGMSRLFRLKKTPIIFIILSIILPLIIHIQVIGRL